MFNEVDDALGGRVWRDSILTPVTVYVGVELPLEATPGCAALRECLSNYPRISQSLETSTPAPK